MKKSWIKWGITIIGAFTVVVGVPIIVNECYKNDSGYMTMWDAADVLSYCGTIIGAVIGVGGVWFTIHMANQNYREDARNRILPYIAIDVLNIMQPDPLLRGLTPVEYGTVDNNPIIEEVLEGKAKNHLFFVIDGPAKVRATEELHEDEIEKIKAAEVIWIRAAKDGKMYLRSSEYISMPFLIENIGNGHAKKLRMAFSYQTGKPFFKTEILLKKNERFYVHIFSTKSFEEIKGNYIFKVCYEDISGNAYEQLFPVEIVKENGKRYNRIDTNGTQQLMGRVK